MENPVDHGFRKYKKGILITFILIVLITGLVISVLDFFELQRILRDIRFSAIIKGLFFVVCSYSVVTGAYWVLFKPLGHRVPLGTFIRITLISVTTNYVVASGGVGGTGLRAIMLSRYGISYMKTVCLSLIYFALSNMYLCLAVLTGLAVRSSAVSYSGLSSLHISILFLILFCGFAAGILVTGNTVWSRAILTFIITHFNRIMIRFRLRSLSGPGYSEFIEELSDAGSMVYKAPFAVLKTFLLAGLDWVCYLACFHYCFQAAGADVPFGLLLLGTGIGVLASMVSMIPGGLGIMEGTLSLFLIKHGLQAEQIVVAVLLVRSIYYVLPFLISFIVSLGSLRDMFETSSSQAFPGHNNG